MTFSRLVRSVATTVAITSYRSHRHRCVAYLGDISQEASGGEEGNQDNEDNPNIDAHQNSCRRFVPADTQKQKKAPGTRFRGLKELTM